MWGARAPRRSGLAWRLHFESEWGASTGIPQSMSTHGIFPLPQHRAQSWLHSCVLQLGLCGSPVRLQGIVIRFQFFSFPEPSEILAWETSQSLRRNSLGSWKFRSHYHSCIFRNVSDTCFVLPCSFFVGTGMKTTFLMIGGSVAFFPSLFRPLIRTNFTDISLGKTKTIFLNNFSRERDTATWNMTLSTTARLIVQMVTPHTGGCRWNLLCGPCHSHRISTVVFWIC